MLQGGKLGLARAFDDLAAFVGAVVCFDLAFQLDSMITSATAEVLADRMFKDWCNHGSCLPEI